MKSLIVGSGGFMGRRLVSALRQAGHEVRACSSTDGSGIDPASGLLPDSFSIAPGTDAVFYMAQSPYFRQVPDCASHVVAVNAMTALKTALLAREAGVRRFVYLSTGTVYAPAFSPIPEAGPVRRDGWYGLSKLHGEECLSLLRGELQLVIVRPFGVYGPGQQGRMIPGIIDTIKNGRPIVLQPHPSDGQDGGLRISLCFVDDAIRVLVDLGENGGPDVLNLAGPDSPSITEIGQTLGGLLGRPAIFREAPTPRDTDLIADISLLRAASSHQFRTFEEGAAATVEELLRNAG